MWKAETLGDTVRYTVLRFLSPLMGRISLPRLCMQVRAFCRPHMATLDHPGRIHTFIS